jgi:hypothetical protein
VKAINMGLIEKVSKDLGANLARKCLPLQMSKIRAIRNPKLGKKKQPAY